VRHHGEEKEEEEVSYCGATYHHMIITTQSGYTLQIQENSTTKLQGSKESTPVYKLHSVCMHMAVCVCVTALKFKQNNILYYINYVQ
jgi:hypothetical protein